MCVVVLSQILGFEYYLPSNEDLTRQIKSMITKEHICSFLFSGEQIFFHTELCTHLCPSIVLLLLNLRRNHHKRVPGFYAPGTQYIIPPKKELLVPDTGKHNRHLGWSLSTAASLLWTTVCVLQSTVYFTQCSIKHTFKSLFPFLPSYLQRNKVHIKIIDQCHRMPTITKKSTVVWKFMLGFPQQLFHSPTRNISHSNPKCFKRLQKRKG